MGALQIAVLCAAIVWLGAVAVWQRARPRRYPPTVIHLGPDPYGPGTDIRVSWPACAVFTPREVDAR